jgi:alkylation response protein AidB-like acyl-CoA dehydrogenase
MAGAVHNATAEEARQLTEDSRDKTWAGKSFMKELFLGNLRVDYFDPYPETAESEDFKAFYKKLRDFMDREVDPTEIDETGEIPPRVIAGLKEMGCFGMKIDKKYGGLGFNQAEYCKALELLACYDGSMVALLSAHQSIGVPQPIKMFGTDEQKKKFLPRCAKGAISAFALTEQDVGSDPARLTTTATRNENGDFVISGVKLWCTNGTIAELMVVMARHSDSKKISAFVVEANSKGVSIEHRCRFMGLKALYNGVIRFENVVVPKENLIANEGQGLKVALSTLNTGRLSLPAGCVGAGRKALAAVREFSAERVQWGAPVGKHEAISHKLADMAAVVYAMESLSHLANELSMRDGYDIRLEASVAKEYCSTRGWQVVDETVQIRGGRGYETAASLQARGEQPVAIEQMMRDARINRIFEGSSEIMHLFMAREALDKHLSVAWPMLDPKNSIGAKLAALPKIAAFYALWYPKLYIPFGWFRYGKYGKLASHLRYAEQTTRRLARNVFHGMVLHQAALEKKQAFLFRAVDVAMEIVVMCATIARTQKMIEQGKPDAQQALELTDLHCRNASRNIEKSFQDLWANDDSRKYKVGQSVLSGTHMWVEADAPLVSGTAAVQKRETA